MDSPVPASMFAPEPSSPGAARAAAAAARLHDGFDSDCSEDGEALNGEPELDLTSKVGPGAGGGAKQTLCLGDRAAGRAVSGATAGEGGAEPAYLPVRAALGAPGQRAAPSTGVLLRSPRLDLPRRSQPFGSATWNAGARRRQRPAQCCLPRDRRGLSPWTVHRSRGSEVAGAREAEAREDQVLREGTGRSLFLVLGKETESSRSSWGEGCLRNVCFTNPPKTKLKDGHDL